MTLLYVLATIFGIGFLIFIHELGHYVCARLIGVRVLVFSLGFGRRLLGFRRGGTDYRISLVPLGGYVRVAGEDPTQRHQLQPDDLHAKGVWARALFFSGGVAMNLLFAVAAFPIVFRAGVEFTAPVVGEVEPGSPAWEAGLQTGDRVAQVDGKGMYSFENMMVEVALAGDREVQLQIERGDTSLLQSVQPRFDEQAGLYRLGIGAPVEPDVRLEVREDSPAHRAGLRTGDVLLALDGTPVDSASLDDVLGRYRYQQRPITATVRRGGERLSATFTPQAEPRPHAFLGVQPALRRVAGVRPGLDALGRGGLDLRRGDHILQVNGNAFAGEALTALPAGPAQLTMLVLRPGQEQPVTLSQQLSAPDLAALPRHVAFEHDTVGTAIDPLPGSPAALAGLVKGEEILEINGVQVADWGQLREAVAAAGEGPLRLRTRWSGRTAERVVEPIRQEIDLGLAFEIQPLREAYREESVSAALAAGLVCSVDLVKSLYVTLKKLFTGEVAAKNLGGIVTISRVTFRFAQSGWARFVYFLALLSINLAFINVLPIPVLDGGHLMFVFIEGIKGSPVSPKIVNYSQILGLVFIVALLVFVTYNDILRLL